MTATRFVLPLREGGSLPGLVEADDLGTYVVKFTGAGQGRKVLVAEVLVGELARRLDIPTPRLAVVDLPSAIARYEADEEVQDLLNASPGCNLGVDFLPGSFGYDGSRPPSAEDAGAILWLDAYTANVDRTWANPNLLVWHGRTWAIDHGAALWFHHSWPSRPPDVRRFVDQPFDPSGHVLAAVAEPVDRAHERLAPLVTPDVIQEVVALVPDEWLEPTASLPDADAARAAYVEHLTLRLANPAAWTGRCVMSHPYQYVVLRYVPRVDRGECLNVGVVVHSQSAGVLRCGYHLEEERILAVAPDADLEALRAALEAVCTMCERPPSEVDATLSTQGKRFGWISAPRSTVLQPGPVHGGSVADPAAEVERLIDRLVR